MKKLVLAAVLSSLFSLPAHAQFLTGNQLFEQLSSFNTAVRGQAEWYILGVADVAQAERRVCMAAGVSSTFLAKIIADHLREWPEFRTYPVGPVVMSRLELHYPCPK